MLGERCLRALDCGQWAHISISNTGVRFRFFGLFKCKHEFVNYSWGGSECDVFIITLLMCAPVSKQSLFAYLFTVSFGYEMRMLTLCWPTAFTRKAKYDSPVASEFTFAARLLVTESEYPSTSGTGGNLFCHVKLYLENGVCRRSKIYLTLKLRSSQIENLIFN